jgi:hypothetical protein
VTRGPAVVIETTGWLAHDPLGLGTWPIRRAAVAALPAGHVIRYEGHLGPSDGKGLLSAQARACRNPGLWPSASARRGPRAEVAQPADRAAVVTPCVWMRRGRMRLQAVEDRERGVDSWLFAGCVVVEHQAADDGEGEGGLGLGGGFVGAGRSQ